MAIVDKAVPNVAGFDIGYGMYTVDMGKGDIDFAKLDEIVHTIPAGKYVWGGRKERFDLTRLKCYRYSRCIYELVHENDLKKCHFTM